MRSSSVAAPPTETQCASRRQPKSDGSSAASVTWPNATTTLTLRTRRFGSDGLSGGVDVSGNKLSNAPGFTADAGVQYSRPVSGTLSAYGRADVVSYGSFQYDDANTAQQDAYSLTNLRGGVRSGKVFIEGWVRNAFNKAYVLTAFAYPLFAPSGFIGENGPARTFGVRAGVTF